MSVVLTKQQRSIVQDIAQVEDAIQELAALKSRLVRDLAKLMNADIELVPVKIEAGSPLTMQN